MLQERDHVRAVLADVLVVVAFKHCDCRVLPYG